MINESSKAQELQTFKPSASMRSFREIVKYVSTLPISPWAFYILVFGLRRLGVLQNPSTALKPSIRRIFVSHPYSSVGDMVLLLPLLERIRMEWPEAVVDIVVGSNASDLLTGVQGLGRIFVCGSQNTRGRLVGYYRRFFRNLLFYKRHIMPCDYDLAVAPRWGSIMTSEAVYLAFLTGASRRVGYSASVGNGDSALDKLLTHPVTGGEHEHESIRNLRVLERAGLLTGPAVKESVVGNSIQSLQNLVRISNPEWNRVKSLPEFVQTSSPYAVVSPGATRPFNRWPLERLAAVMQQLCELYSLHFYVVGAPSDALVCERLSRMAPRCATSVAGSTSLRQLTHLLARAELFLGMDSGIAHLAGGLGGATVVVSPFPSNCHEEHPNSPVRFRPCGPRVRVLQPEYPLFPCFPTCSVRASHCIEQITIDQVVSASIALVGDHTICADPHRIVTPNFSQGQGT